MLIHEFGEFTIKTIRVKDGTLEVTNKRLGYYSPDKLHWQIPLYSIRSISPVKNKGIRIQVTMQQEGIDTRDRRQIELIVKDDRSVQQICHDIIDSLAEKHIIPQNEYGLLYLQPNEHVISVFDSCKTNQGTGKLYITDSAIALETIEGISFDLPFEQITIVSKIKKNKLRLVWQEFNRVKNKKEEHKFDITLPKDVDTYETVLLIQNTIEDFKLVSNHVFVEYEKRYNEMSPDKLHEEYRNMLRSENSQLAIYLGMYAKYMWGWTQDTYYYIDRDLIFACKYLGYDTKIIHEQTEQEKKDRMYARHVYQTYKSVEKQILPYIEEINTLKQTLGDDYEKDKKYKKALKMYNQILSDENGDIYKRVNDYKKIIDKNALKFYDERVQIIYSRWCESNGLKDFETDDDWINYLLGKYNDTIGKNTIEGQLNSDDLNNMIKIRDRNRSTIASFSAPEHIPKSDVYNNGWYDKERDVWWIQNDNMPEPLQKLAEHELDDSQGIIGRRVWGFKGSDIDMVCGFPAIRVETNQDDDYDIVYNDRETGNIITYEKYKTKKYIIVIIQDTDITMDFIDNIGSIMFESAEIQCNIRNMGVLSEFTKKQQELFNKKYGLPILPINERVRRNIFQINTSCQFYGKAPMQQYCQLPNVV